MRRAARWQPWCKRVHQKGYPDPQRRERTRSRMPPSSQPGPGTERAAGEPGAEGKWTGEGPPLLILLSSVTHVFKQTGSEIAVTPLVCVSPKYNKKQADEKRWVTGVRPTQGSHLTDATRGPRRPSRALARGGPALLLWFLLSLYFCFSDSETSGRGRGAAPAVTCTELLNGATGRHGTGRPMRQRAASPNLHFRLICFAGVFFLFFSLFHR